MSEKEIGALQAQIIDIKSQQIVLFKKLDKLEDGHTNSRLKLARIQWTLGPIGVLGTALGIVVAKYFHLA